MKAAYDFRRNGPLTAKQEWMRERHLTRSCVDCCRRFEVGPFGRTAVRCPACRPERRRVRWRAWAERKALR